MRKLNTAEVGVRTVLERNLCPQMLSPVSITLSGTQTGAFQVGRLGVASASFTPAKLRGEPFAAA